MTADKPKLCQSCAHWYPEAMALPNRGECRRYPPMIDGWPPSKVDDWCGEHKAREAAAEE